MKTPSLNKLFFISKQLETENQKSFVNELKSFLRITECQHTLTSESLRTNTLANLLSKITDKLNNSKKLNFYKRIKMGFYASNYTDILKNDC